VFAGSLIARDNQLIIFRRNSYTILGLFVKSVENIHAFSKFCDVDNAVSLFVIVNLNFKYSANSLSQA